jgi:hypothetical protein
MPDSETLRGETYLGRDPLAVLGLTIVPPFISVYDLLLHVSDTERKTGVEQQVSPALNTILLLVLWWASACTRRST